MSNLIVTKDSDSKLPKTPDYCRVSDGINEIVLGGCSTPNHLKEIKEMVLKDNDVLLISYPRSGSTWMQRILVALKEGPDMFSNQSENKPPLALCPFLEAEIPAINHYGYKLAIQQQDSSYRIMKTHLPSWLADATKAGNSGGRDSCYGCYVCH